jgi:hypothetical protein
MPEDSQGADAVKFLREPFQHTGTCIGTVHVLELGPFLRVDSLDPGERILGVECRGSVVVGVLPFKPAVADKVGYDLRFEVLFLVDVINHSEGFQVESHPRGIK